MGVNDLLLAAWREACRHVDIEKAVEALTRLARRHVPAQGAGVWDFEWERELVELRAAWPGRAFPGGPPRHIDPGERRILEAWTRRGRLLRRGEGGAAASLLSELIGGDGTGDWCAGPLLTEHGTAGAFVLRAAPGASFAPEHVDAVAALLEPVSVALEVDRRLRELNALREAAEADKRSALSRLGRDDLMPPIIGANAGLAGVMERVALVARSDVPVLILGETGTGKELVARAIHEQSHRAAGPFIRVNCGAIPSELIDSELFGHERGAFTGATASRRGWFERADNGTLLLDEIGEMSLPAQVRLLRVLQEGTFERVGGEKPIRVDVRVVAATHRDLPALVQAGKFREDLWYRISGFPIVLPPLRERKQDIPALVDYLAARASARFGLRRCHATPRDLALLTAYDWPGNIRELASVIDRAAILGNGERLDVARALGLANPTGAQAPPAGNGAVPAAPDAILTLDEAMRRHIESALAATRGQIEGERGAARILGINPHTLRARMRKLGIDWARFR